MSRASDRATCAPGCRLETGEDEIETPTACPWPASVNAPRWRAADHGEVGPA